MLLEVVVVWLVVSPVIGVGLGLFIARASLLADRHELRRATPDTTGPHARTAVRAVPQPATTSPATPAGPTAGTAAEPSTEPVMGQAETAPHAALKLVTDVPGPRPAPSLGDVLHLRMAGPER